MTYFALLCSFLALVSGVKVIGSGLDWRFSFRDLIQGRENALAYLWVTASTAFSIVHTLMLAFWIYIDGPTITGPTHNFRWMAMHAIVGFLFFSIHLIIKNHLIDIRGDEPKFLWGTSNA